MLSSKQLLFEHSTCMLNVFKLFFNKFVHKNKIIRTPDSGGRSSQQLNIPNESQILSFLNVKLMNVYQPNQYNLKSNF